MIDICLPTRSRPGRLSHVIKTIKDTANDLRQLAMYIYVDDDDTTTLNSIGLLKEVASPMKLEVLVGPSICISIAWNKCAEKGKGDILMHAGDDLQFETKGWDSAVRDHFVSIPDSISLYGATDGLNTLQITHGFVSRKSTDILGYFLPPYFFAGWNDTWLWEIYSAIERCTWDTSVMVRHLHPGLDMKWNDEVYDSQKQYYDSSHEIWKKKEGERKESVMKLKQYIDSYKEIQ